LRNPLPEPLTVPLPANEWWRGARFGITRPGGTTTDFTLPGGSAGGGPLTLFDEAELEKSFSLESFAEDLLVPGWYELHGDLPVDKGYWPIEGVRWLVEPVFPMEVFVSPVAECRAEDGLAYWKVVRGEQRAALYKGEIAIADESAGRALSITGGDRLADVSPVAQGLMGMECPGEPIPARAAWVAWLESNTLRAGVSFALFNQTSIDLPGQPGRILPHVITANEGGAEVWVLAASGDRLWRVTVAAPEQIDAPAAPAVDEDDYPDPRDSVRIAVPAILEVPCPVAATHGAVGRWKEFTAVALLAQTESSIEVRYGAAGEMGVVWGTARIDQARLMPGTDPVIALDDNGVGRVAVLFQTQDSVGVAALAFDSEAKPSWSSGIRREIQGPAASLVSGAISLRLDGESGLWICSWAAAQTDGSVILNNGGGESVTVQPPGKPLSRTVLCVWPRVIGAAYETGDGELGFMTAKDGTGSAAS